MILRLNYALNMELIKALKGHVNFIAACARHACLLPE